MKLTLTPEELLKYINIPGMVVKGVDRQFDGDFVLEVEPIDGHHVTFTDEQMADITRASIAAAGYATSTPAEEH